MSQTLISTPRPDFPVHLEASQRQDTAAPSTSSPGTCLILPDFESHFDSDPAFALRTNKHCSVVTPKHNAWLLAGLGDSIPDRKKRKYADLNAGLLISMCLPEAPLDRLQVCCDFMGCHFGLDDLTDDMDEKSASKIADTVMNALYHPYKFENGHKVDRMTRDYRRRMDQTGCPPGALQRFQSTMDLFLQAVHAQALDRNTGVIPTLEAYIDLRRDGSACKPCWVLIEYSMDLHIPDEVMEHPSLMALGEAANDLVTWHNDVFSYNVEQARGDTHNMVCVVMQEQGLDLQSAIDFVGEMCKQSVNRFVEERANLPSWGPDIDRDVQTYVAGLASCVIGNLEWSYLTTRYFGDAGMEVKRHRVVELLPRKQA